MSTRAPSSTSCTSYATTASTTPSTRAGSPPRPTKPQPKPSRQVAARRSTRQREGCFQAHTRPHQRSPRLGRLEADEVQRVQEAHDALLSRVLALSRSGFCQHLATVSPRAELMLDPTCAQARPSACAIPRSATAWSSTGPTRRTSRTRTASLTARARRSGRRPRLRASATRQTPQPAAASGAPAAADTHGPRQRTQGARFDPPNRGLPRHREDGCGPSRGLRPRMTMKSPVSES